MSFADRTRLAAGVSDHTIRIWSLAEDEPVPLTDLLGHTGIVYEVAFIGDDELLSGADDRTIRRWDLSLADVELARELARRRANRELDEEEWEEFFIAGLPWIAAEDLRRRRDAADSR